ncbi:MAG: choice-of-anchor D domain-containing protein [Salinibacter sp.]|uniref:choice-of-anchor D domain-containing protein n=1 Tax=Salinibacter sp. TaxID=2065818 RepID=UPI0035D4116F
MSSSVLKQAKTDFHGDDLTGKDGPLSRVGMGLTLLYHEYQRFKRRKAAGPFKPKSLPMASVHDGRVTIDAAARAPSALASDLRNVGAQDVATFRNLVSARVPIDRIPEIAGLATLRGAYAARAQTMWELNRMGRPRTGSVTSEGDSAMNSDDVRDDFGIDGSGTTMGIISDSYNNSNDVSTTASEDMASGDLPPSDRITVLEESNDPETDEGRAMMHLAYDVAPGTDFAFHTGVEGRANFAEGIIELADAGADVIVDDLGLFIEPFYQDGVISQAIDSVSAEGIPYFSAAGNDARQSYASTSFETVSGGSGRAVYDFDSGPSADTLQQVTVFKNTTAIIILQWDDPWFSVTGDTARATDTDIDFSLLDKEGTEVLSSSTFDSPAIGDPIEFIVFENTGDTDADADGTADTRFNLRISKLRGPDPGRIKYFWGGTLSVNEFGTESPTVFGHQNASGGAAVAAANYQDTPEFETDPAQPESFTSLGGVPILFDDDGIRFSEPEVREQPRFTGPDGTSTSIPEFNPFSGTSAAAPHVAAVAALQLQANPDLTPSEIYTNLADGASDMEDIGYDFLTGAGFVQAAQTITSVTNEPNIEVEPLSVDFGTSFFDGSAGELISKPSTTVRVRNSFGTAPLNISNSTLSGSAFSVTSGSLPSGQLGVDESTTATVTFDPSSAGTFSETLTIDSDDPDESTVTVPFDAEAVPPPVAGTSPDSLAEAVEVGNMTTKTLSVANSGGSELGYDVFAEALDLGSFDPGDVAAQPTTSSTTSAKLAGDPPDIRALPAPGGIAKQAFNPSDFIYTFDDGSVETSLGAGGVQTPADILWLNAFEAQEGATTITAIASAFGQSLPAGSDVEFLLYEDPNNDGNPEDANLLASVSTTKEVSTSGEFQVEPIPPTQVEDVFFVGALAPSSINFPAPLDTSSVRGASWSVFADAGTIDTGDLSGGSENQPAPTRLDTTDFPGNWALRAQGAYVAFDPVSDTLAAGSSRDVSLTFDGTSLSKGKYEGNIAVSSNDPRNAEIDLPFEFFVADAAGDAAVSSDGTYSFDDTGLVLDLSSVQGSGTVTAARYDDSPSNVSGLPSAEDPSSYRWVAVQNGDLQFDASSTFRFERSDIPGPGFGPSNGDDVTAYARPTFGTGSFSAFSSTSYDDNGTPNDPSDDAIVASGRSGLSEFILGSETAPLPVEMAGFEGRTVEEGRVRLTWQTTSETNSAGFNVQRRIGERGAWQKVGFVESKAEGGTTTTSMRYRFTDADLPYEADSLTYRLQQVDLNGTTHPTEEIVVGRPAEGLELRAPAPNPVRGQATVRYAVPNRQDVTLRLYDVLGRRVETLVRGTRTGRHETSLDVSGLSSGTYFLRLKTEDALKTRRLTVLQ